MPFYHFYDLSYLSIRLFLFPLICRIVFLCSSSCLFFMYFYSPRTVFEIIKNIEKNFSITKIALSLVNLNIFDYHLVLLEIIIIFCASFGGLWTNFNIEMEITAKECEILLENNQKSWLVMDMLMHETRKKGLKICCMTFPINSIDIY